MNIISSALFILSSFKTELNHIISKEKENKIYYICNSLYCKDALLSSQNKTFTTFISE